MCGYEENTYVHMLSYVTLGGKRGSGGIFVIIIIIFRKSDARQRQQHTSTFYRPRISPGKFPPQPSFHRPERRKKNVSPTDW